MTLAKRISIVRMLSIVQIAIPMFFLMIGALFAMVFALSESTALPPAPMIAFVALLFFVAVAVTVGLPWIVLNAITVRKENWATAAFVSLIVQIVCGGGILSLLPIISLVLLLDKEASAYIGMK